MTKPYIITRIKGGLGNQLFCYAAARHLAIINQVDLLIDDVTGFARDLKYQRQYQLDRFNITASKATPAQRLEPFERYRRKAIEWISSNKPFSTRSYLVQEGMDFDKRFLTIKVEKKLYLDGYWQSESYFKDIAHIIRQDLKIMPPSDAVNHQMAEQINNCNAVAVHVRWFDNPSSTGVHNLATDYYQKAIDLIEQKVDTPHYFLFSDDPAAASKKINLPQDRVTFVTHNQGDENAYADLWLMSQCRSFITANSTFSWWGAWLSESPDKIVLTPNIHIDGVTAWGFEGLIPPAWILV
jgi:hypothetical protein